MAAILVPPPTRERAPLFDLPVATEAAADPARLLLHQILTIEPACFLTREHARAFRAANFALRSVRVWYHAVEWVEHSELDTVLLDLDALDARISQLNVSARRVVELLRHTAGRHPLLIAAVTRRDFVEVEETVQAGVDVFVPSAATPLCLVQRITAAHLRRQPRALARTA
jgi:DNA-binding NarL/FixJ family response regulator